MTCSTTDHHTHRSHQVVCVFLLILLARLVVASAYHAAVADPGIDITLFYQAAERLNDGRPLYSSEPFNGYVYAPALALMLQPLAAMGKDATIKAWALLNCGLLLTAIGLFCWATRLTLRHIVLIALLILVSFRYWPTTTNFWLGQTNFILLALLSAMFVAQRRGQWWLFGVLIATAAIMKTWMIGLVVYLIIQRQWKALLWCFTCLGAGLIVLFSIIGWHEWPEFVRVTLGNSVQPDKISHSWLGVARLHLTGYGPMPAKVDSMFWYFAAVALGLLVLGLPMLYLMLRPVVAGAEELALRLALVTATMLLAMPLCHREYLLLLLPLFWCLLTLLRRPGRWRIAAFLAASATYLTFTRGWPDNGFGREYATGWRSLLVSAHAFFSFATWLIGFGALWRLRAEARTPEIAIGDQQTMTRSTETTLPSQITASAS